MKAVRICAALLALIISVCSLAFAEAPVSGALYTLTGDTPVYADASLETLIGILSAGETVYAEEWDEEGNARIVFIYQLLLTNGWIRPDTALLLEDEALEDYLRRAGGDGMRYRNAPLLPAVFAQPGGQSGATAEETAEPVPFVPVILRQPEDQTGRVGQTVTFSVEAENVVSYRWQFHNGRVWKDSTMKGCNTPAMEVEVAQKRFSYMYRCILTFADGTVLFSDEARILHR